MRRTEQSLPNEGCPETTAESESNPDTEMMDTSPNPAKPSQVMATSKSSLIAIANHPVMVAQRCLNVVNTKPSTRVKCGNRKKDSKTQSGSILKFLERIEMPKSCKDNSAASKPSQ